MDFSVELLKIAGIALSLAGTVILAIRVTKILSALSMAVKAHDLNLSIEAARADGRNDIPNIHIHGSLKNIEDTESAGLKLLILGFTLQIIGSGCTALSYVL